MIVAGCGNESTPGQNPKDGGAGDATGAGGNGARDGGTGGTGGAAGAGGGGGARDGGTGGAAGNGGATGTGGATGNGGATGAGGGDAGTDAATGAGGTSDAGGGAGAGGSAVDAAPEGPPPAPATTIAASPIDFGAVTCGTAGGERTLAFTNSGTAALHFAAGMPGGGGMFSLRGAAGDGSVSGDVAPGASGSITVVSTTIPTSTAAGAAFQGVLRVTTNAAGAAQTDITLTMTAEGSTCTLTCSNGFTKCTPSGAAPYCANTATDNSNCGTCGHGCGSGEACSSGACTLTCGALTKCTPSSGGPYCANTTTDNADCGACGHACGAGEVCSNGACTLTCGALTKCMPSSGGPYCANTATDNADCGTCGRVCASGQVCSNGACTLTCGALTKCTPSGGAAEYCTNTMTDNADCGACGHVCGSGETCNSGVCTLTCGALTKCTPSGAPAYCANTMTDNADCGTCGHACPGGQVCSSGTCTLTCGSLTKCTPSGAPAYCTNTMTDNADCGTCGHACPGGQVCTLGSCVANCLSSEMVCGGQCTNTAHDPSNCGTCGHACTFPNGSAACSGGGCFLTACDSGHLNCNGSSTDGCEVDKMTDALHCGSCSTACGLGETCNAGACTTNLGQGIILQWNLDDASGATAAADASANHLNGTVVGSGVTFVPGAGKQGSGAVTFSGGGYLRAVFPNNVRGDGSGAFIPLGNITFSMWFKTTSPSIGGLQVIEGGTWGGGCDRVIGNGSGATLNYNAWSEVNMSGVTTVNDGAWHHLVYVLDRTNGFKAYLDGVLDISTTSGTGNCGVGCSGFDWASEYWVGRGGNCRYGADSFAGTIDDVRMYDHVLSPSGVTQLYNATR